MTEGARIELSGITKTYRRGDVDVPVLHGIDLTIEPGERVSIMGRSGSGKSTLLSILGCLDQPSTGTYAFDGADVARLADRPLSHLRRDAIGFVFQAFHLLPSMTVVENVALPMEYGDTSPEVQRARAVELLHTVGLEHRLDHKPHELSGGEKQRVAIARSLANKPRLLLADEPTGALDSKVQETILGLFGAIHARFGTTMVVVTHDAGVAKSLGDRVLHMSDGRLV